MQYDMEHYAGFWRRVAASFIDTVIMLIVAFLIHMLLFGNSGYDIKVQNGQFLMESSKGMIEQLIIVLFTVFMWIKFLGTPGKLLLGCHVVDAETHKPLKVGQALVRYVAYFVSAIPLCLGFFWVAWDKRKQGFHDKIAGTVVIVESTMTHQDESQKSINQLMEELR